LPHGILPGVTRWALLVVTILSEVSASLALKAALTRPAWFVVVVVGYSASFVLLAVILRMGMPLGVTYGIWSAAGVALTAVLSAAIFGEPLTGVMLAGIGLIAVGVLCIELGAQRATARAAR
jgi:small multidrug resistance pump